LSNTSAYTATPIIRVNEVQYVGLTVGIRVKVWGWCYPMGRGPVLKKGRMKEMKPNFTYFASVSGGQDAGEFQYLNMC
jgi:hypothetical protein